MTTHLQAIILAAGKSTRFNTNKTKLLEPICGQPMVLYPINMLASLDIPITMVIGYQKEELKNRLSTATPLALHYVEQEYPGGTGHAILSSRTHWEQPHLLIMNGDMPLVTKDIIQDLIQKHTDTHAAISFVTAHDTGNVTSGYGRVIETDRGQKKQIEIVEARDFTGDPTTDYCINAGIYLVSTQFLEQYLPTLTPNTITNELYFTDLIKMASDAGLTVSTLSAPFDSIRGVNTLQELWAVEQIKRAELIKHWMHHGVRFSMPHTVHMDLDVTIGSGSVIDANVHLTGTTSIGTNCIVHPFSTLHNVSLGNNVTIYAHCVLSDSQIHANALVGPFAHVRTQSTLHERSVIGNFVEVKQSSVGEHSKAKHLTYLGDAQIGRSVNIGAGTIICNYDGTQKHATTIEDNVFIGSNNTLVAPLTIQHHAFTAAGSTITKTVPPYTLAFGRSRQVNKEGYVDPDSSNEEPSSHTAAPHDDPDQHAKSFRGATKTDVETSPRYLD